MYSDFYRKALAVFVFAGVTWFSTPVQAWEVTVQSEFGRERITPRAGAITVDDQAVLLFDAPEFVYLNRRFEELDEMGDPNNPDDSKVAYYKARIVGPVVNGTTVQGTTITGTKLSFVKTIGVDTTVVWKWTLEYAVFVEAATIGGTTIAGTTTEGNVFGSPSPALGRQWVEKNTQFSASVVRAVGGDLPGGDDSGSRYVARAYELQNIRTRPAPVPSSPEYYWKLSGKRRTDPGYQLNGSSLGFVDSSTTIAWWSKIDRKLDSKRDQVFFQLLNSDRTNFPLRIQGGLPGGEWRKGNSMTFGVRPDGQLFVEEVTQSGATFRELVSVPSPLVGLDWHHWAMDFDFPEWLSPLIVSGTETFQLPFAFGTDAELSVFVSIDPNIPISSSSGFLLKVNVDYALNATDQSLTLLNNLNGLNPVGQKILVKKQEIRIFRDGVEISNSLRKPLANPFLDAPGIARPVPVAGGLPDYSAAYDAVNIGFAQYHPASVTDDFAQAPLEEELEGGLKLLTIWQGLASRSDRDKHARGDRSGAGFGSVLADYPLDGRSAYSANPALGPFAGQSVNQINRIPFPPGAREILRVDLGPVPFSTAGDRVATENVIIDDWLRVRTLWEGQVRYRFDATGGELGDAETDFSGQSFVRYYDVTGTGFEQVSGNGLNTDVWIPLDRKVETGSFYRTYDRCFTLRDFVAKPSRDLLPFTSISKFEDLKLPDALGRIRVARVAETIATAPSEIHFVYAPTTFRAEIPLGQSLDALNPDLQLVPALCDGAVLRTGRTGPDIAGGILPVGPRPPGIPSEKGALRWDQFSSKLLPAQPGTYQVFWPDSNDGAKRYKIEIVSGYPSDEVELASEREMPDGAREVVPPNGAPNYVRKIRLAEVDDHFPAAPGAHYRHRYDPATGRRPPTRLDPSAVDNWAFQDLTFADLGTDASADTVASGVPFNAAGTGRSVLLYSFRSNPDEIADGTLTEESLAVRVVESSPVAPILPDSPLNPLGRNGMLLGAGSQDSGAVGIVSRVNFPALLSLGDNFVIDFWLNTKNLQPTDDPVTVLSTGAGKLEVLLDPKNASITTNYFATNSLGLSSQHPVPTSGSGWTHFVVHVFTESFFAVSLTILDFYADGERSEDGTLTMMMPAGHNSDFDTGPSFDANGLTLGAGARPESQLLLDQLRLFDYVPSLTDSYLGQGEVRKLRESRVAQLRGNVPLMRFDFESSPSTSETGVISFPSSGNLTSFGIGPSSAAGANRNWVRHEIQEVATLLTSALDDAGFNGGGYILNEISNYNASLYQRDAEPGAWGSIFPVNHGRLFPADSLQRLEIAYYENPFRQDVSSHPNVAWPYREAAYDEVIYPTNGPHKDKAIYIASRVGSEGVDRGGRLQKIFRADQYANLAIYNQPNLGQPGYNPNEEHAIAASGNRASLKLKETGEDLANEPAPAAFALQSDINVTTDSGYTSDPWVLVQVDNVITGEPEMAAYQVFKNRPGTIAFPRPTDLLVNAVSGLSYESAPNPEDRFLTMDPGGIYNFTYGFSYPAFAGDLLIPPYPLNLVIGNIPIPARGGNSVNQRTLWWDVNGAPWIVSGNGTCFYQYHYPMRGDFYLPSAAEGAMVAWVPDLVSGSRVFPMGTGPTAPETQPAKVVYESSWRSDYPKLKRGETLTYQGGEYFNENPGSNGLPAVVAMKAAEIVFDVAMPRMIIDNNNNLGYSAAIVRPLDRREAPFTIAQMVAAGFSPASPRIFVVAERW